MIILTRFSSEQYLWTTWWVVIALLFPVWYWLYERYTSDDWSITAWLGVMSVLLTWGIALLKLPTERIAIKEALVPTLIWIALAVSLYFDNTLIKKLFGTMLDTEIILSRLGEASRHIRDEWLRRLALRTIASFALSAILNYLLATHIVVSPAWTEAFAAEIGRMTWLSFPVIALPATILLTIGLTSFMSQLHSSTWLEYDQMIRTQR